MTHANDYTKPEGYAGDPRTGGPGYRDSRSQLEALVCEHGWRDVLIHLGDMAHEDATTINANGRTESGVCLGLVYEALNRLAIRCPTAEEFPKETQDATAPD